MCVLVVEDEPELLSAIAQSLREGGNTVDTAEDGTDGLFKAQNWDYDAVVLDLMFPGLNGKELLKRLHKTHRVLVSARDTVDDRVVGLDLGADDYLANPFESGERHVRRCSQIHRAAGPAAAKRDATLYGTERSGA